MSYQVARSNQINQQSTRAASVAHLQQRSAKCESNESH
jgi:hypothetical protein